MQCACFEPAINGRGQGVSGVVHCWLMICLFLAVLLFAGEDGVGCVGGVAGVGHVGRASCVACVGGVGDVAGVGHVGRVSRVPGDDGVGGVGVGPALSSTQHYQLLPH